MVHYMPITAYFAIFILKKPLYVDNGSFYEDVVRTSSWSNERRKQGRICEVGPPRKLVVLFTIPYSAYRHSTEILLCEAGRLPSAGSARLTDVIVGTNKGLNMEKKKIITRKNSPPIKVYCLPEEKECIGNNAKAAGLSLSAFLLTIGQGYRAQGIVDYEQVRELARINGDLGRLGGLLKLWLTNDVRTASFGKATILALLDRIEENQNEMGLVMKSIIRPRSEK
jgi:hypothetical protein